MEQDLVHKKAFLIENLQLEKEKAVAVLLEYQIRNIRAPIRLNKSALMIYFIAGSVSHL